MPYKKKYKKALLLTLFCVFLSILIDFIKIKNSFGIYFTSVMYGIITILIFNKFLFEKKLEKHKKLSIFLICLFNFPIFIYYCILETKQEIFDAVFFIFNSVKFCIYQYIINYLFISFYFIFFIEGLCYFISFVIINIIFYLNENKYKEYYNLKLLLKNIIHFSVHFLYFFHIYFYDSMNCMILEIFSRGFCTVIFTTDINFKIIETIDIILSLFFIIIYEEIIILNFCEFDKYVQKNILKREKEYENELNKF